MFLLRALLATLLLTRLVVAQELGFEAQTPLELGLVQTLAWYKEAGWLKY
jgi:nucleoside-diphosphate-sugar epimerase